MIKLPKKLTTVTPFSKFLAMGLFLLLPFVGFLIGMRYQETLDFAKKQDSTTQAIPRKPLSLVDETANWKTYEDKEMGFSIEYPPELKIVKSHGQVVLFFPEDETPKSHLAYSKIELSITSSDGKEGNTLFEDNYVRRLSGQGSRKVEFNNVVGIGEVRSTDLLFPISYFLAPKSLEKPIIRYLVGTTLCGLNNPCRDKENKILVFRQILSTFRFLN